MKTDPKPKRRMLQIDLRSHSEVCALLESATKATGMSQTEIAVKAIRACFPIVVNQIIEEQAALAAEFLRLPVLLPSDYGIPA